MTYTLVDYKWVCFADCCRIGATGPGGPLNMHRQRRDTPLLYTPSIYTFYNLHGADKGTVLAQP